MGVEYSSYQPPRSNHPSKCCASCRVHDERSLAADVPLPLPVMTSTATPCELGANYDDKSRDDFPNRLGRRKRAAAAAATGPRMIGAMTDHEDFNEDEIAAWTLVHECSVARWLDDDGHAAGFTDPSTIECDGVLNADCTAGLCIHDRIAVDFLRPTTQTVRQQYNDNESHGAASASEASGRRGRHRSPLSTVPYNNNNTARSQTVSQQRRSRSRTRRSRSASSSGARWCRRRRSSSTPRQSVERGERFRRVAADIEYRHIPAEQRLRVVGIVCHRAGLAVLQLLRTGLQQQAARRHQPAAPSAGKTVFGLIRVDESGAGKRRVEFLGLLDGLAIDGNASAVNSSTVVVAGDISPDLTRCLLRVPSTSTRAVVRIYDLVSRTSLPVVIDVRSNPDGVIVRFDTRHRHTRIAVIGVVDGDDSVATSRRPQTTTVNSFPVNLVIFDEDPSCLPSAAASLSATTLCRWRVYASNTDPLTTKSERGELQPTTNVARTRRPFDVRYSADGHLLFVTVVDTDTVRCLCRGVHGVPAERSDITGGRFAVCVLDASSAVTLGRIDFPAGGAACVLHSCPRNFRPTVSQCGRYVALRTVAAAVDDDGGSVRPTRTWRTWRPGRRRVSRRRFDSVAVSSIGRDDDDRRRENRDVWNLPPSTTVGEEVDDIDTAAQVRVYRLPTALASSVESASLHAACRRTVLAAIARRRQVRRRRRRMSSTDVDQKNVDVACGDIRQLPLPSMLIGYLNFDPGYA